MSLEDCSNDIVNYLKEQRAGWVADFKTIEKASGNNILVGGVAEELAGQVSQVGGSFVNGFFEGLTGAIAANPALANAVTQIIQNITIAEELQLALFGRLRDKLVEYLDKRINLTLELKQAALSVLVALGNLPPKAEDEIVARVKASQYNVKTATKLLDAVDRALLASPPLLLLSYVNQAGQNVNSAIDVLGDTSINSSSNVAGFIAGNLSFNDLISDYYEDLGEQYRIAFVTGRAGLKRMVEIMAIENNNFESYILPFLNIPLLGARNNTILGVSPKIKSVARQVQLFPFHIAALGYLVDLERAKYKRINDGLKTINSQMEEELQNVIGRNDGGFRAGALYARKIVWLTELNLVNLVLGNNPSNIFNGASETLSNLLEDTAALQNIINYVSQPGYISDINNRVEQMQSVIIRMVPSLLGAFFSQEAHNMATNYLQDLNIHCNALIGQDNQLRQILNTLVIENTTGAADAVLDYFEEQMEILGDAGGFFGGELLTTLVTIAGPGLINQVPTTAFDIIAGPDGGDVNIFTNNVDNVDLFSYITSGLVISFQDTLSCFEQHGVNPETTNLNLVVPAGPDAPLVDTALSIATTKTSLDTKLFNSTVFRTLEPNASDFLQIDLTEEEIELGENYE